MKFPAKPESEVESEPGRNAWLNKFVQLCSFLPRAILQSGTLVRPYFLASLGQDRAAMAQQFGARLGCRPHDLLPCLKAKRVEELVVASFMFSKHTAWQPVVDPGLGEDSLLPRDPLTSLLQGSYRRGVDVIVGSNVGDGLVQARELLKEPSLYRELREDWEGAGSRLVVGREGRGELAGRIREEYMGSRRLDSREDRGMVEMMTDNMYQVTSGLLYTISDRAELQKDLNPLASHFFKLESTLCIEPNCI